MRPVVFIADKHRAYLSRLEMRLRSLANTTYDVLAVFANNESEMLFSLMGLQREVRDRIAITIYPDEMKIADVLQEFPSSIYLISLCENTRDEHDKEEIFPLNSKALEKTFGKENLIRSSSIDVEIVSDKRRTVTIKKVPRFTRAQRFDAIIREYLMLSIDKHAIETHSLNSIGTHLSFSQEMGNRITKYVIGKEQTAGHTVIYFPIKPLYLVEDRFRRGHGKTIGDLIYRFSAGDVPEINDLGQWLYMHENGYYTFSLPERSDDIISSDISTLKQIINLLREYTHTRSQPTTSWIDIDGLPLSKTLELAVLCDFLYVDAPVGTKDKEEVARRELALFMAKLPKECIILELPKHRPSQVVKHRDQDEKEWNLASEL